jgi:hypothetical protein
MMYLKQLRVHLSAESEMETIKLINKIEIII